MSISVKWNNETSGPLTRGWIPNGLTHNDFDGSFNNEIEPGWLVGKYNGELITLPDYGLIEYVPSEPVIDPETERAWRDSELSSTDWIVPIIDHSQHAEYIAYRVNLRNWPESETFPTARPTL